MWRKRERKRAGLGRCPGAFQLGHTGCVSRCNVAVEGHAEFGVSDSSKRAQAIRFAEEGQPGPHLYHKAGVDRLGQDEVHKPTSPGGDGCGKRKVRIKVAQHTCRKIHLACMEHTHDKEEDYNSWRSRHDIDRSSGQWEGTRELYTRQDDA